MAFLKIISLFFFLLLISSVNAFFFDNYYDLFIIEEGVPDLNSNDYNFNWINTAYQLCIKGECRSVWPSAGGGDLNQSDANAWFWKQTDLNSILQVSDFNNVWVSQIDGNIWYTNGSDVNNWFNQLTYGSVDFNIEYKNSLSDTDTNWATFNDFNRMFYSQIDANNMFLKQVDANIWFRDYNCIIAIDGTGDFTHPKTALQNNCTSLFIKDGNYLINETMYMQENTIMHGASRDGVTFYVTTIKAISIDGNFWESTGGTMNATNGTPYIVGTGTDFTQYHSGLYLRMGGTFDYIEICDINSATEITLCDAYYGRDQTGQGYDARDFNKNIIIENITFDTHLTNNDAIATNTTLNLVIQNNKFTNFNRAIYLKGTFHGKTYNNIINKANTGIWNQSSFYSFVYNNLISNVSEKGIYEWGGSYNEYLENLINYTEDGLVLFSTRYNVVLGNSGIGCNDSGLSLQGASYNEVIGNNFRSSTYGISIDALSIHNTLLGNNLTGNGLALNDNSATTHKLINYPNAKNTIRGELQVSLDVELNQDLIVDKNAYVNYDINAKKFCLTNDSCISSWSDVNTSKENTIDTNAWTEGIINDNNLFQIDLNTTQNALIQGGYVYFISTDNYLKSFGTNFYFSELLNVEGDITAMNGNLLADRSIKGNDTGGDFDSWIESDHDASLFYLDASTDRIGISKNTPSYTFDIDGTLAFDEKLIHVPPSSSNRGKLILTPAGLFYGTNAAGFDNSFYAHDPNAGTQYLDWALFDEKMYGSTMKIKKITALIKTTGTNDYITNTAIYSTNATASGCDTIYTNTTNYGQGSTGVQTVTIYNSTGLNISNGHATYFEFTLNNNVASGVKVYEVIFEYERV